MAKKKPAKYIVQCHHFGRIFFLDERGEWTNLFSRAMVFTNRKDAMAYKNKLVYQLPPELRYERKITTEKMDD